METPIQTRAGKILSALPVLFLLFDSAIKASIVLLVGIVAAGVLRRRSAAARHWMLAVAIVCAGAVPLVGWLVPAWQLPPDVLSSTARQPSASAASPG